MELPLAPSEGHSTPWLPSLSGPSDRPLADQARLVLGGPSPILGGTEQRDELIEKVQAFMQATCGHGVKRCKGNERRVPIRCLCADCSFEVILRSGKKCNNVWTVDFNRSCWEHKLKTGSGPCSSLPRIAQYCLKLPAVVARIRSEGSLAKCNMRGLLKWFREEGFDRQQHEVGQGRTPHRQQQQRKQSTCGRTTRAREGDACDDDRSRQRRQSFAAPRPARPAHGTHAPKCRHREAAHDVLAWRPHAQHPQ